MINDFKDLKKLIDLCRKQGVDAIEVGGVKIGFGPMPVAAKKSRKLAAEAHVPGGITEDTAISTDGLSPEDLLFYSASGQTEQQ